MSNVYQIYVKPEQKFAETLELSEDIIICIDPLNPAKAYHFYRTHFFSKSFKFVE